MDVIKNRRKFQLISSLIIIAGIIMFLIKGFNLGIDFAGGTIIEINMGKYVDIEEVKDLMDKYDDEASIVHAGSNNESIIIKSALDLSNEDTVKILKSFNDKYDIDSENYQTEKFEAFMGEEIKKKALLSMTIAVIAMLIYITIRFKFEFGISAIIALIHDILVMLAFYSIFRVPVNSSFIAAILTILGYSINDTIVIFDRIRENIKLYPKKDKGEIVNKSINESLRRTIYTSITTFVAVLVVFIIGVEDMKVLALPLMVGILSGTYSSLFIASPLLYELSERNSKK